jgi:8-oxo-dGTP diphosphatase
MSSIDKHQRPLVGVGVMIIKDNKVLLGKRIGSHGSGSYGWAGGHLEFGESLEECAVREVFEETGVKIKRSALKFLCLSNIIEYGKHYVDIEFLCSDFPGEPKLTEPTKRENWKWYNINRLPKPLFKAVELTVNKYKKHIYN